MTMELLAHSAQGDIDAQPYKKHVCSVYRIALKNMRAALKFYSGQEKQKKALQDAVSAGALLHDLGKLDDENQNALREADDPKKLPLNHVDAGTAWLWQKKNYSSALLVYCHHRGLFSLSSECKKGDGKLAFRDEEIASIVDKRLENYITKHKRELRLPKVSENSFILNGLSLRLALSCLVDADHHDTARHYNGECSNLIAPLPRWEERLHALDQYVTKLAENGKRDLRNALRDEVYQACRCAATEYPLRYCDAPVGTGKTTAVMAHLLSVAAKRNLRHIFVVLPYTNIIEQSVNVYRKALVLDGEDPEEVVAAHYHQADFSGLFSRQFATLWKSPIIVTTGVQFFETLASCKTSRLRKLHELPGSAVFIDEAHAVMPLHLWPQQWLWLQELARDWNCHFVLASGSLVKFWEHESFSQSKLNVESLLPPELRKKLQSFEKQRVIFPVRKPPLNRQELIEYILSKPGPRLVILNTVQSAAVIAHEMRKQGYDVLHLSTVLTPKDRGRIIERVNKRLKNKSFTDWTLVATSCVEAGVDFSFKTAFRESCSVTSLIQIGGRANRHGTDKYSEVIDFRVRDKLLNKHPAFDVSRTVLDQMFGEGLIESLAPDEMATEAVFRELGKSNIIEKSKCIKDQESAQEYKEVAKLSRVINADSHIVVIHEGIVSKLENRERVSWIDILKNSVQIWSNKVNELGLEEIKYHPELYHWGSYPYDPEFLGYMEALLPMLYGYEDDKYGLII